MKLKPIPKSPEMDKLGFFARFSLWASRYNRAMLLLALIALVGGVLVYSRLIDREGFPQLESQTNIVTVNYFVDDAGRTDAELARPLTQALIDQPEVESISTVARPGGLVATVTFVDDFEVDRGPGLISQRLTTVDWPDRAVVEIKAPRIASFLGQYDALVAVHQPDPTASLADLEAAADQAADQIGRLPVISVAETVPMQVADTEQPGQSRQVSFSQAGLIDSAGDLAFHPATYVGINYQRGEIDAIGFSSLLQRTLPQLDLIGDDGRQYHATVAGDLAESVNRQIDSLQNNLLAGLVAIVAVSFLLISWRAALVTIPFMIIVVLLSIGLLYLLGFSLNTVVLFSLVLALGLFVDDATIVIEAIESQRQRTGDQQVALRQSLIRVVSASWAGTLTTVLAFAPLFFVTGLLGEIVRPIPATVIVALLVSFILSVTLIPVLSKYLILKSQSREDWLGQINPFPGMMRSLGRASGWLPGRLAGPDRRWAVAGLAGLLAAGVGLIVWSAGLARSLDFNIFPPVEDSDLLFYQLEFPPDYDLATAELATESVQTVLANTFGAENITSVYYGLGQQLPNQRQAGATVSLSPYQSRSVTSSALADSFGEALERHLADSGVRFRVFGVNPGPQVDEFPLRVLAIEEDPARATRLVQAVNDHLLGLTLKAPNGSLFRATDSRIEPALGIQRRDGQRLMAVGFQFDNDNISTVLRTAEDSVRAKFTPEFLAAEGFSVESLDFDLGQESDNEGAFASLYYIFPITIVAVYILLALQFRSVTKPFLMLIALPLSLPGVVFFLYLTDNPLSFLSLLGLVGLGGIVVNNTILLTEYANQQRRAGQPPSLAIAAAVNERLRPLVATTLTTLVVLIPLIINEPFWEGLAGVIVSGLFSSTLLVIFVFPSFYLGGGWIWRRFRRWLKRSLGLTGS